jgi:hypothetical protein
MVSTSFPREILVHESTELGCWEVVSVSESRRPPTSRTTTRARIEQKQANDIEIALARPKQTRLRRRPEQVFSCHHSLRDLSTTSKETNRVEGRRHTAIVPSATYPSNVQTTTTPGILGIHQQRWFGKVVDQGSAVTSRPVRASPTLYAVGLRSTRYKHRDRACFNSDQEIKRPLHSSFQSIKSDFIPPPIVNSILDPATYLNYSTLPSPIRHVK